MSELPGTSAVSIEAVEWSAEHGGNLTVRITGRWRRRRPVSTGQPTLVIEAEGRRHRYPAMPEPPSVGGTGPGLWRLSFTIPGWMAPDLGRTWLQFGTVIVPLPVAVPAPGEGSPSGGPPTGAPAASPDAEARPSPPPAEGRPSPPDAEAHPAPPDAQARPSPPDAEAHPAPPDAEAHPPPPDSAAPAAQAGPEEPEEPPDFDQTRRVTELTQRVGALEEELRDARAVRDELAGSLEERERKRRIAEQRAHAEQALRRDLARQLSGSGREAERVRQALGELAAAEERIRMLETELAHARRRSDEAEQVAAAATAARQRAERERSLMEQKLVRGAQSGAAETSRVRFEQVLHAQRAGHTARIPREPAAAGASPAHGSPAPPSPPPAADVRMPPALRPAAAPLPVVPPRPAAPGPTPAPAPDVVARLHAELEARGRSDAALRARLIEAESRLAARVVLERRTTTALTELRGELNSLADELARERALRAGAERRAGILERELEEQRALARVAHEAIGEVRAALQELAAASRPEPENIPEPSPAAPDTPTPTPPGPAAPAAPAAPDTPTPTRPGPAAPAAASPAPPAPAAASPAPPAPAAPPAEPPAPAATSLVEPARLNDALSRLRETIAPQDAPQPPSPVPPRSVSIREALARPSLERAFRGLARSDPDAAGRLVLELLPLQRAVYPHAVSYDLILGPDRCVWVSVTDGTPAIEVQTAARPRNEVDFQVVGDPARLARLLTAGRWRRRLGWGTARVRGRRQALVALSALLGAPLDLGALYRAGVRPDPLIALGLLAAMIEPAWSAADRFTLAHAAPDASRTYLVVSEGAPLTATRIAPTRPPDITLSCPTEHLMAALAGEPVPGVRVTGDVGAFLSLRKWIKRAQSE